MTLNSFRMDEGRGSRHMRDMPARPRHPNADAAAGHSLGTRGTSEGRSRRRRAHDGDPPGARREKASQAFSLQIRESQVKPLNVSFDILEGPTAGFPYLM